MLENKFKIITILTVIILALTLPVVRAENETEDTDINSDAIESENISSESVNLISDNSEATTTNDDNFKKTDIYLTGDDVTIDYIIDGNLFVVANTVTINSQIGGDAFIFANTVTVGEQGYVFSNLFTVSKNVNVNGVVYDLYSASENTTINGYVYRDIRVGSNTVNIFGTIGRNAYVNCVNFNFTQENNIDNENKTNTTSQGIINGNLNYTAKQEVSIPNDSVIGETTFKQEQSFNTNTMQEQIISLGSFVVTVIVIWLLCLWLAPNFLKKNTSLLTTKKVLPVIGFGILVPIVSILLAIILLILGITSTVGLLLLTALFSFIAISTSIFIITINNIICGKLKIKKTIGMFGILVVSSITLWLIYLIPIIGSFVTFVTVILGLGIIISSLVLKDKTDEATKETK